MKQWPPSQASLVAASWTVNDLQEGDLIFCARKEGVLAVLSQVAGEPWRHVGSLLADGTGGFVVVEVAGDRFQHRPLGAFLSAYDTFGAARLDLAPDCLEAANEWMYRQMIERHIYAWDDLVLAGTMALTQRGIFRGQRDRVRRALAAAAQSCKPQLERRGAASLTCSAFVQLAYDSIDGGCSIVHERWRSAHAWPPQLETLDAFFDDPSDDVEAMFEEASILDLFALTQATHRSGQGSKMAPDHVGELVRVLLYALGGYVSSGPLPDTIGGDGRWVTPGDLWSSPSVRARAYLTV